MNQFFRSGRILHGGDYNPEQWLDSPEILEKDIAYMKEAHINEATVGIFSWSSLEPEEGNFDFSWLEERINILYENGIRVILATPSGSRPKWLADKYPEVLRVDRERNRNLYGLRHNHCYTSGIYREKVRRIDMELAKRFGSHPGVIAWHISNEFGGECHCPLCQQAFRDWLKEKYQTVDKLNKAWMTTFWSHTYQDFDQVEGPSPRGEISLHGLNLDWRRFVTHQTVDFAKWEIDSLRMAGAMQPATTNMMYNYEGLNYFKFAEILDFISWDNYPLWHKRDNRLVALDTAMQYDTMRGIKDQPFYLMESCPSAPNWQSVSKLKAPGLLEAASLQAVAHGSDSVLYFQFRQSRGSYEKFHGAVIDHYGGNDTRVFREVKKTGEDLTLLGELQGSRTAAEAAVIYDWENRWALEDAAGVRNKNKLYKETVEKSYQALRNNGINVDVIDMERSLDRYKIVAAPMLYLFRADIEKKLRAFVERGGTLVMTYWSGIVDETDLCFLGGTPHGLMDVLGLRSEEIDSLFDGEENRALPVEGNSLGLSGEYVCEHYSDLVKTQGAEPLMVYGNHFYKGKPALTVHSFGKGKAYYVCTDMEQDFYNDFYEKLLKEQGIRPILPDWDRENRLLVTSRESGDSEYIFLQNFDETPLPLPGSVKGLEALLGGSESEIGGYETVIVKRPKTESNC